MLPWALVFVTEQVSTLGKNDPVSRCLPPGVALSFTSGAPFKNFGHLDVQITIDDPKAYEKPRTVSLPAELATTTDLVEYVCVENEKSLQHMVGR